MRLGMVRGRETGAEGARAVAVFWEADCGREPTDMAAALRAGEQVAPRPPWCMEGE